MAASLLISCSDESTSTPPAEGGEAVSVLFGDGVITRASGTTWSSDDRVGIYMFDSGTTTSYSYGGVTFSNIQYSNSSEDGASAIFEVVTPSEVIYYQMDNAASDFLATYPYNSALTTTNFLYPLSVADQRNKPAIDFMTASLSEVYTSLDPLAFSFSHKLAQLNFEVKAGDGDPDLEGLAITVRGLINSATYDVVNPKIDFGTNAASDLVVYNQNAIVIPQRASVVFHVSTKDSPDGFDTDPVDVDLNGGETTTITLTLNRLTVNYGGSSTIEGWVASDKDFDLPAQQVAAAFSVASRVDGGDGVDGGDDVASGDLYDSATNGNIGIYMYDAATTTSIVDQAANIEYAADANGAFSPVRESEIIYYPEGDVAVDFVAYAPYSATKMGADDFVYEVNSAEQIDLLVSAKLDDKRISEQSLSFGFRHILSQIELSVSSGIGSPNLDGLKIVIEGLTPDGTCQINAATPELTLSTNGAEDMEVENNKPSIVMPQLAELKFKVTTSDNPVGFTTIARGFDLEAGKTTKISLKLNKTDVDLSGASTVETWEVVNNDGDIELF